MRIEIPKFDLKIELPSIFVYILSAVAGISIIGAVFVNLRTRRHKIKKSLQGTVILITGATAGIGKECARELAKHGATIHILARDLKRGETAANEIKKSSNNENIFVHFVNLSDFTSVRLFAKKFLETDTKIDILINNAALVNPYRKDTVDGLEENLQANYLSHFMLTNLLLERIISSSPSRIINVSSDAYDWVRDFDVRDMSWKKKPYDGLKAYWWSRLETVVWTRELARRLYGKGVSVNSVHPGPVKTSILRNVPIFSFWTPFFLICRPFMLSPYLGAQTILYLATSDDVKNVSGHYFANCRPEALSVHALDDQLASELWWESDQLTSRWRR